MSKKKELILDVSVDECVLSPLNTRRTHPEESIEKLAERIERYGFETTRALWVVKNDDLYEIFAGGIRWDASKRAGVNVAVYVHSGFTDEEIVQLSDKDNEDDEYHTEVPPVDIWENYARLRDMGWKQERIAKAKNTKQNTVSWRLKLHDKTSDKVKENIRQGLLDEGHLHEIFELSVNGYLSGWLTTEETRQEMVDRTITKIQKESGLSTRALRKDVKKVQEVIDNVEKTYNSFGIDTLFCYINDDNEYIEEEFNPRQEFLDLLSVNNVRSLSDVAFYANNVRGKIDESIRVQQEHLEGEHEEITREREMDEKLSGLKEKFLCSNCLGEIVKLDNDSVKLLLTDPPYGKDYQSKRRKKAQYHKKIENDKYDDAIELIEKMIIEVKPKLMKDSHLLVFIGKENLCNLRKLFFDHGFTLKGELIWVKDEHGAGDIKGSFAPQHEYIIHAVQGKPLVSPRRSSVFTVAREGGTRAKDHPTKKPVELLEQLIDSTTDKGELVVDPFAGVASTLIASHNMDRKFWGCEIDEEYFRNGMDNLENLVIT